MIQCDLKYMLQMLRSFICNAGVFYTSLEEAELEADKQMHKNVKKIKLHLRLFNLGVLLGSVKCPVARDLTSLLRCGLCLITW